MNTQKQKVTTFTIQGVSISFSDQSPARVMICRGGQQVALDWLLDTYLPTSCATSFISTMIWLETVLLGSSVFLMQRYFRPRGQQKAGTLSGPVKTPLQKYILLRNLWVLHFIRMKWHR